MARFNEILVGRYHRFLQRLLSMKGSSPSPQLASEIQPQFDLNEVPIELKGLLGWTLWAIGNSGQAVVTGFTAIRIRNPASSGVIVVVEKLANGGAAASNLSLIMDGTTTPASVDLPGGNVQAGTRDPRKSASQPSAIVSVTAASVISAFTGNLLDFAFVGVNQRTDFIITDHQEIVIAPGHFLTRYNNAFNSGLVGILWWRERAIEEGELTF